MHSVGFVLDVYTRDIHLTKCFLFFSTVTRQGLGSSFLYKNRKKRRKANSNRNTKNRRFHIIFVCK